MMASHGPRPVLEKRRRPRSRFASAGPPVTVFVGNLPPDVTDADLRHVLPGDAAGVVSVRVPRSASSNTAERRGFGFIDFTSADTAAAGIAHLSGAMIGNSRLRARLATERGSRPARGREETTSYEWGGAKAAERAEKGPEVVRQEPTMAPSGALQAAAAKTAAAQAGVTEVGAYREPGDAALPRPEDGWRIFVFDGDKPVESGYPGGGYPLMSQRVFLLGRDLDSVHIPVPDASASKQHAAIQFRRCPGGARPYIFDLDSLNGSFLNDDRVDGRRYVELRSKDVLRFGVCGREYVLISENEAG